MVDAGVWATLGAALRREAGAGRRPPHRPRRGRLGAPCARSVHPSAQRRSTPWCTGGCWSSMPSGPTWRAGCGCSPAPELVLAAPDAGHRPDMVYIGPDSPLLVEVALRLAPRGERAVDLGTGTGLLAAALSRRYRCVVATDIVHRAAEAARCTMMLNDRPPGHVWLTVRTDVTSGLRTRSFDLVAANTPWVPTSTEHERSRQHLRQRRSRRDRAAVPFPRRGRGAAPSRRGRRHAGPPRRAGRRASPPASSCAGSSSGRASRSP